MAELVVAGMSADAAFALGSAGVVIGALGLHLRVVLPARG